MHAQELCRAGCQLLSFLEPLLPPSAQSGYWNDGPWTRPSTAITRAQRNPDLHGAVCGLLPSTETNRTALTGGKMKQLHLSSWLQTSNEYVVLPIFFTLIQRLQESFTYSIAYIMPDWSRRHSSLYSNSQLLLKWPGIFTSLNWHFGRNHYLLGLLTSNSSIKRA